MALARYTIFAACIAALSACATHQFDPATTLSNSVRLGGSKVYVYSFLDVRDDELGPQMLTQMNLQLTQALANAGVVAKVLPFKESKLGRYISHANTALSVPVGDTIASNASEERSFGATYRLVIFPSEMRVYSNNAWRYYDFQWELFDTSSGRVVWRTVSHGKHMFAVRSDEEPESRAKLIVDGVMDELSRSRLLRRAIERQP